MDQKKRADAVEVLRDESELLSALAEEIAAGVSSDASEVARTVAIQVGILHALADFLRES